MAAKHWAAFTALILISTPSIALEVPEPTPTAMFQLSVPLDARTPREQAPTLGLSLRGKRQYQVLSVDTHALNFSPLGNIEPKWIIAGVVAAGAAIAVASKDKSTHQSYQQQQQQQQEQERQQQQNQAPCPVTPKCP